MTSKDLKVRIDQLIELADRLYGTTKHHPGSSGGGVITMGSTTVNSELFHEFRSASLSFIERVFGHDSTFYKEFTSEVKSASPGYVIRGRGILKAVKGEIDGGWIVTVKDLITAEIFTDFMSMANHLLEQGYKDPAAVMIGGVLEETLRQLCIKNGIDPNVISPKDAKELPKSSDRMNNELSAGGVYNKLYHKSVVSWLDLRNKAAHGHYGEYNIDQVKTMESGVSDFIVRNS